MRRSSGSSGLRITASIAIQRRKARSLDGRD
jgi:hypothetical protein